MAEKGTQELLERLEIRDRQLFLAPRRGPSVIIRYGLWLDGELTPATTLTIGSDAAGRPTAHARVETETLHATIEDRIGSAPSTAGHWPPLERSTLAIERHWAIEWNGARRTRCIFPFIVDHTLDPIYWLVPAVIYGTNDYGDGHFPRGGPGDGWSFREDRCALPSGVIITDARQYIALCTEPATTEAELSSIMSGKRGSSGDGAPMQTLELRTPYTERPRRYIRKFGRGALAPPVEQSWVIEPHARREYSRRYLLQLGGVPEDDKTAHEQLNAADAIAAFYGAFWAAFVDRKRAAERVHAYDWARYIQRKSEYAMNVHYVDPGHCTGFLVLPGRSLFPLANTISAAFLGRSAELAFSLYRVWHALAGTREAAAATTDQIARLRAAAVKSLDFLCTGALPSGLCYNSYQIARRRWSGYVGSGTAHASCRTMGFTAYNLLRAYALLEKVEGAAAAREHSQWLATARGICDFFTAHQLENGSYGKWWSTEGRCVDDSGVSGAYLIWAMVTLWEQTGEEQYLASARRAADYYIDRFVCETIYWGDALDSNCIDKEGGHSVLRALLLLSRALGEDGSEILPAARRAAAYVLSWMFAYDVPFAPASALARHAFSTLGGTSVSVAHHHMDMYGAALAVDFLRLSEASGGEPHWREYALAMLAFVTQMVAAPDNGRTLGYPSYYRGLQPEQYNHTEWDYIWTVVKGKGGFRNQICWVPALTLGALLDLREEFPAVVGARASDDRSDQARGGDVDHAVDGKGMPLALDPPRFATGTVYRLASLIRRIGIYLNFFI